MLTDIEIAQNAKMLPIGEIAAQLGVKDDELELYGRYKAKITDDFIKRTADRPNGKLVLVTAINPTPAGEGKTTTTVGLGMAMKKIGKNAKRDIYITWEETCEKLKVLYDKYLNSYTFQKTKKNKNKTAKKSKIKS